MRLSREGNPLGRASLRQQVQPSVERSPGSGYSVYKAKSSNSDMPYVAIIDSSMKAIVHSDTPMIGETVLVAHGRLLRKTADGAMIRELQTLQALCSRYRVHRFHE